MCPVGLQNPKSAATIASKSQPRHYCFAFELGPAERFFALVFLPLLLIQLMFISAHVISFQPQAMLGREVTTKRITKRIRMCSRTEKTRPEESVQINTVPVKVVVPFRLFRLSRQTWVCRHWTGERKWTAATMSRRAKEIFHHLSSTMQHKWFYSGPRHRQVVVQLFTCRRQREDEIGSRW